MVGVGGRGVTCDGQPSHSWGEGSKSPHAKETDISCGLLRHLAFNKSSK